MIEKLPQFRNEFGMIAPNSAIRRRPHEQERDPLDERGLSRMPALGISVAASAFDMISGHARRGRVRAALVGSVAGFGDLILGQSSPRQLRTDLVRARKRARGRRFPQAAPHRSLRRGPTCLRRRLRAKPRKCARASPRPRPASARRVSRSRGFRFIQRAMRTFCALPPESDGELHSGGRWAAPRTRAPSGNASRSIARRSRRPRRKKRSTSGRKRLSTTGQAVDSARRPAGRPGRSARPSPIARSGVHRGERRGFARRGAFAGAAAVAPKSR